MGSAPHRGIFSSYRTIVIIILVLLPLAVLASWIVPYLLHPVAPENAAMPISSAIEDKYGIRISQVAVTADGGMIDFRYQVTDPVKAANFALDPASTPVLYAGGSNVAVNQTSPMSHKELLHVGTTYFLLYKNASGSIAPRTYISIVLGDLKLDGVPVR